MKKIYIFILAFCLSLCPMTVGATEAKECGYLIKVNPDTIMLLSAEDELTPVCEGLYKTENETVADQYRDMAGVTVFPDYVLELYDTYPAVTNDTEFKNQWCLDTIGAAAARQKGITGKGVTVAVIDSGIKRDHPDFAQVNILPGCNAMDGTTNLTDTADNYGHGTMVSGIIAAQIQNGSGIAGIASDVTILPIKITNGKDLTVSSMMAGLQAATRLGCDVINMSFGGVISHPTTKAEMKKAVDSVVEKGIAVICAVGNAGGTQLNYPAAIESTIGVGAINRDGTLAYFSQRNKSVWVTAPGVELKALDNTGKISDFSGTSAATPVVTAVVALMKQVAPEYTPAQIKTLLSETAQRSDGVEYCTSYGYGVVSIQHIMEALQDEIPNLLITKGSGSVYLHNNSETTLAANAYFAEYTEENNGKKLENISYQHFMFLPEVTEIRPTQNADTLLLWDETDACKPLTDTIILKP